jgi:outer membrane protein assembly factor BamE (lipoprotein component of BamABCDE complex)
MIKNILIFLSGVIFGCLILIIYGLYFSKSTEELIEERSQLNYGYKTEITIKNKIYELTFGMSKDEVKSKIGKPSKVDVLKGVISAKS